MPVTLLEWKSMPRNSLRGFAKIRLGKSLIIRDVSVHCSHGKNWASLPSKPIIDRDGNVKKDQNGKVQYVAILEWENREAADAFSQSVIEAVERQHPGSTAGDFAG